MISSWRLADEEKAHQSYNRASPHSSRFSQRRHGGVFLATATRQQGARWNAQPGGPTARGCSRRGRAAKSSAPHAEPHWRSGTCPKAASMTLRNSSIPGRRRTKPTGGRSRVRQGHPSSDVLRVLAHRGVHGSDGSRPGTGARVTRRHASSGARWSSGSGRGLPAAAGSSVQCLPTSSPRDAVPEADEPHRVRHASARSATRSTAERPRRESVQPPRPSQRPSGERSEPQILLHPSALKVSSTTVSPGPQGPSWPGSGRS